MDDAAVPAHGVEGRGSAAVPDEISVAVVLEDRDPVGFRQPQELAPALLAHDGAGRILHGRDRVDVFGTDVAALEVVERGGQRIQAQALAVERYADRLHAQPGEPGERTL